jgi:formylglycine-generating enzyme required for sulfatase activity
LAAFFALACAACTKQAAPIPEPPLTDAQNAVFQDQPVRFLPQLVAATGIKVVPIPAGTFTMGSPTNEPGRWIQDGNLTQVRITRSFWLGRYAVTQGQWQAVMGTDLIALARPALERDSIPGLPGDPLTLIGNVGDDYPIYFVSWTEAVAFCRALTDRERSSGHLPKDYEFRLPTEAEWEYACRAGTTEATYAGKMVIKGLNNAPVLDAIAWYGGNSNVGYTGHGFSTAGWGEMQYQGSTAGPREVGRKQPNVWGLYDMLGNVDQWCADWHAEKLAGGSVTDPQGPENGTERVYRGGSWTDQARTLRAASRARLLPDRKWPGQWIGFRVALSQVR